MVICSAYGCKSRSDRKEIGITFHRLPLKHKQRLNLWIENMKLPNWTPTTNHRLCSKHFERNLFYEIGIKTCLKDDAVPTIFLELPKNLQLPTQRNGDRSAVEPIASTSVVASSRLQETPQKKKLRRQLFQEKVKNKCKSQKIRVLRQKLKRYKEKIIRMNQLLLYLKSKILLVNTPTK